MLGNQEPENCLNMWLFPFVLGEFSDTYAIRLGIGATVVVYPVIVIKNEPSALFHQLINHEEGCSIDGPVLGPINITQVKFGFANTARWRALLNAFLEVPGIGAFFSMGGNIRFQVRPPEKIFCRRSECSIN